MRLKLFRSRVGLDKSLWHRWYAWRPVKVGEDDWRWLEYVRRKGEYFNWPGDSYWRYEYLPKTDGPADLTIDTFNGQFDFKWYRKRPVEVRALQVNLPHGFYVDTLEGRMTGKPGDYLILGIEGERYPCAASVFKKTYEPVEVPT